MSNTNEESPKTLSTESQTTPTLLSMCPIESPGKDETTQFPSISTSPSSIRPHSERSERLFSSARIQSPLPVIEIPHHQLEKIVDDVDFSSILSEAIEFDTKGNRTGKSNETTEQWKRNGESTGNDRWEEFYSIQGDPSSVVTTVSNEDHHSLQSISSKEIDLETVFIDRINHQVSELVKKRLDSIAEKERVAVESLFHDEKKLVDQLLERANLYRSVSERRHREILDEFIRKLNAQMAEELDEFHRNLSDERDEIHLSVQENLQRLTIRAEEAKKGVQQRIIRTARQQIEEHLKKIKKIRLDRRKECFVYEQSKNIHLNIVSKFDQSNRCETIKEENFPPKKDEQSPANRLPLIRRSQNANQRMQNTRNAYLNPKQK